jgi:hypothetical protein
LHYQLEQFLREGIESGRSPPKQSLLAEQELQDFFGLSRTPRQKIKSFDGSVEATSPEPNGRAPPLTNATGICYTLVKRFTRTFFLVYSILPMSIVSVSAKGNVYGRASK